MAVNGKTSPDTASWVVKRPDGTRVKVDKKEYSSNSFAEAAAVARRHLAQTGEWCAPVRS